MIVIVDYGMGNLHSVKKKLDQLKVENIVSSNPKDLEMADKIILPGVGHFGKAMENLRNNGWIEHLNKAVLEDKKPILGICLGMQLMAETSEERNPANRVTDEGGCIEGGNPDNPANRVTDEGGCIEGGNTKNQPTKWSAEADCIEVGLGWFDAEVVKFQQNDTLHFKTPHTGWNTVSIEKDSPLFKDIPNQAEFYFVHSYYIKSNDQKDVLNYTEYGQRFVSSLSKDNIFGVQYHPEKSHDVGMQILKNFVEL